MRLSARLHTTVGVAKIQRRSTEVGTNPSEKWYRVLDSKGGLSRKQIYVRVRCSQQCTHEIRAVPLEPSMVKELGSCRASCWILPEASLKEVVENHRETDREGRHVILDNSEHDLSSALYLQADGNLPLMLSLRSAYGGFPVKSSTIVHPNDQMSDA